MMRRTNSLRKDRERRRARAGTTCAGGLPTEKKECLPRPGARNLARERVVNGAVAARFEWTRPGAIAASFVALAKAGQGFAKPGVGQLVRVPISSKVGRWGEGRCEHGAAGGRDSVAWRTRDQVRRSTISVDPRWR